ncbi:MAG TPA: acyl carrier protein [Patescibacteria group bacterium]|jgi:acyl carrier protein|nr:acyl carrier protein [Patescibacteria group bacterium]
MSEKNRTETFNKVADIVAENLSIDRSTIIGSATLESLGADSLNIIEIIMKIEEEFGITINDEEAESLHTLDAVVDYVHNLR